MAVRTSIGLRWLQFFVRMVIFLCAIVVLIIFAYFISKLNSSDLNIPTWVRAVEGLSGAAALYCLIAFLLLWFVAGHPVAFVVAVVLDICFIASFIYIAVANRGGSGNCNRDNIRTPFGTANANVNRIDNQNGVSVNIPTFRVSCRLEKACLAVSIIAIVFLLVAIGVEFLLARSYRREKKFGPGPNNNYTSGSGRRFGLFGKKRKIENGMGDGYQDPNALPAHTEPSQMRESYATEATAVGHHGYGENGAVDPNKPVEPSNRTYGNMNPNSNIYGNNYGNNDLGNGIPAVPPNTNSRAVSSRLANKTMRGANSPKIADPTFRGANNADANNADPTFRGVNYADPTVHNGNYVDPTAARRADVDPNLQSSVDPRYLRDGSALAEAPANEVPTVRGTGVDNYANIRNIAVDHTAEAYGTAGTAGTANLAGAGEGSAIRGTGVDNYANDNYANIRGTTTEIPAMTGAGVGASADTGAATATTGAATSGGAPSTTIRGTGVDNYANIRGAAVDPNVWGGAIDPATGNSAGLRGSLEAGARDLQEQAAESSRKYGNPPQF